MFGAVAACRAKYRRSAVRAEAPPCGGSQTLAPLASARKQHSADRSRACELKQRALFLNEANAACRACPATTEVASLRAGRLRPAQHCELQNRRTTETSNRTTVRKQLFLINPPAPLRCQRTAESTGRADETVSPKTARRVKQTCLNLRRREDVPARNRGPCHSGP